MLAGFVWSRGPDDFGLVKGNSNIVNQTSSFLLVRVIGPIEWLCWVAWLFTKEMYTIYRTYEHKAIWVIHFFVWPNNLFIVQSRNLLTNFPCPSEEASFAHVEDVHWAFFPGRVHGQEVVSSQILDKAKTWFNSCIWIV